MQDVKARWKVIKDAGQDKSETKGSSKESKDKPETKRDKPKGTKQAANKDKGKDKKKDKDNQKGAKEIQSTEPPILSGEEASSEASLPSPQRQKAFLTSHIHSQLYPPFIAPISDAHFSQRDCDVLASADSRYKRARWLEMQANFLNVTGRMVPLEIIRNKIEGAKSLTADLARLEVAERAKSTESWVNRLQ